MVLSVFRKLFQYLQTVFLIFERQFGWFTLEVFQYRFLKCKITRNEQKNKYINLF